nr:MAG TPA: hypothetical protein [Caudoviricetes sp.]
MDKVKKTLVLCSLVAVSSVAMAGLLNYTDAEGNPRIKYIPNWQNPDLIVSEEEYENFRRSDNQLAVEAALEKIGKASGLSYYEIIQLQESSRRQFEREIQEEQRKKAKIRLDDIKPNSGKIEPADWTR